MSNTAPRLLLGVLLAIFGDVARLVGQDAGDLTPTVSPRISEDDGWPFIRGPQYDGRAAETKLADSWPEQGPPIIWARTLGQGYSGFVAWRDRIATQYQSLGGQYVVCLEAETGDTVWEFRYDWPYEPAGVYPGPRATPTYHRGRLYFAAPSGLVGCLDADDGRLLWRLNVHERFKGAGTGFGYSCSPTAVDNMVILPVGGRGASMVALDAEDGSLVWKAGDDAASYTPAYPITFRDQKLILGYLKNALVCHDLQSGRRIWRYELSSGYDEHSAWPIYSEPHLWISSAFQGGSELLELTGSGEQPLRTVWKIDLMSNDIFSSVLVDGALYGFDLREAQAKAHRPSRGQFRCIDFLTGRQHWAAGSPKLRRNLQPAASDTKHRVGHATILHADGKLYLLNDIGELIVARATESRYEELARVSILGGQICWTQPTLYRGRLYARNQSQAVCVFVGDPQSLTAEALRSSLTAKEISQSPSFDWVGALLGVEPDYAFDLPSSERLRNWFVISLIGVLGVSLLATLVTRLVLGPYLSPEVQLRLFWIIAFAVGAVGTTLISKWRSEYVFTWPVSIFIAFQAAAFEIRIGSRGGEHLRAGCRSRMTAVAFVACCVLYFLLCRRLSLVFEWVFLCGFAAALPFTLAGSHFFRDRSWRFGWQGLMTLVAFAVFFWSAAAVLWLKGPP